MLFLTLELSENLFLLELKMPQILSVFNIMYKLLFYHFFLRNDYRMKHFKMWTQHTNIKKGKNT